MKSKIQKQLPEHEYKAYRALQKTLDKMPVGYPKTLTGVEIEILMDIFTPLEAYISSFLDWHDEPLGLILKRIKEDLSRPNSIGKVFGLKNISKEQIKIHLDSVAEKGGIAKNTLGGDPKYSTIFLLLGMYELQVNRFDLNFVKKYDKFEKHGFLMEYLGTPRQQFRVIPIEESIQPQNTVMPYEQLEHIIRNSDGPFGVFDCICKKKYDMRNKSCKVTDRREMCMAFGRMGNLLLNSKIARELTKDEALDLLRRNAKDGLVLEVDNAIQPEYVCSCCSCCCGVLHGWQALKRPLDFVETNWIAELNEDNCIGCGLCVSRCQMDALSLKESEKTKTGKVADLDLSRCIGCGLCVPSCKKDALRLKNKKKWPMPPETHLDYIEHIHEHKISKFKKYVKGIKALLGLKVKRPKI